MKRDDWGVCTAPYLIAAGFPLGLWLGNLSEDPTAADIAATFALAVLPVAVLDLVLRWRWRKAAGRSLWLVLGVVGFFGYGHGLGLVKAWTPIQQRHFAPLWLATFLLAAGGLFWMGRRGLSGPVSRLAARAGILLVAVELVWGLPAVWAHVAGHGDSGRPAGPVASIAGRPRGTGGLPACEQSPGGLAGLPASGGTGGLPALARPDVYYIILDGYARADVLRKLYGYDNRPFLKELASRGFYVAEGARSNYAQTRLSLACSLSMDYLPPVPPGASYDAQHQQIRRLRTESRVVGRLRELGYRYRYVGSMYLPIDRAADEEFTPAGAGRTYVRTFLETTALKSVERVLGLGNYVQDPVAINEYQFRTIAGPKTSGTPLYTFAHIVCPHEPYVYGRDGPLRQPIPADEATPDDYVAQLEYLNGRVLELIDAIDRTSGPEAVVLLQADHGSAMTGLPNRPDTEGLFERMSIFSAYRCGGEVRRLLYPTITPVNSFRVLLAGLFGDELPLREDRSFYSSYETPLDFVETPRPVGDRKPVAGG